MNNSTIKENILKNIIASIDRNTTIMQLCKDNKISYSTFKRWISEDKAFNELYNERSKDIESEFTQELISESKQQLLTKVKDGYYLAIKYVLDNMYINFNSNISEIKKSIIDNIIERLLESDIEPESYKKVLDILKSIEKTVING